MNKLLLIIICIIFASCVNREAKIKVYPLKVSDASEILEVEKTLPDFPKNCENAEKIIVPKERGSILTGSIIEDYYYLPLETTDECLLSRIDKILFDSSYIFIYDSGSESAYCFSDDGKFLCKYGSKGRGPQEYVNLQTICLDKTKKEVCLYDNFGSKMLFYDYNGNFLRFVPMYFRCREFEFVNDKIIVNAGRSLNTNIPAIDYHDLILCKENQQPIYVGFQYPNIYRNNFNYVTSKLSVYNNGIYYHDELSDTIWQIDGTSCYAKFIIEYNDKKPSFSKAEVETITDKSFWELSEKKVFFKRHFTMSNDFVCLIMKSQGGVIPLIYNRISGEMKYGLFYTDTDKEVSLGEIMFLGTFESVNDNGYFIEVQQPSNILYMYKNRMKDKKFSPNSKDIELVNNLSEENNPVLMLVKLKDF